MFFVVKLYAYGTWNAKGSRDCLQAGATGVGTQLGSPDLADRERDISGCE